MLEMETYLGKKCKISIQYNGNEIFFTADVDAVTKTHISFTDKFQKSYTFKRDDITQIHEV